MASENCVYDGKSYEPGSIITVAGIEIRAGEDGRWHTDDETLAASEALDRAAICYWEGKAYSEGAVTCQDHKRMRCMNTAQWGFIGGSCS
jgi:hypothetical protein